MLRSLRNAAAAIWRAVNPLSSRAVVGQHFPYPSEWQGQSEAAKRMVDTAGGFDPVSVVTHAAKQGEVVAWSQHCHGPGNRDLTIILTFRHLVPDEETDPTP